MSVSPSRSVSILGPAGRNGRTQTVRSMIRSVWARMGTSAVAVDPRGAVEQPASTPPNSEACSNLRRPTSPGPLTCTPSTTPTYEARPRLARRPTPFKCNPPAAESAPAERRDGSSHAEVLELPGIALVDVLGEQPAAVLKRRPVAVLADHWPEIRHADLEVARKVHLVGLDDAAVGVLERPDDARQHGRADLDRGRVVVGREPARLLDVELRAVPVGALLVAHQQHAKLVAARGDLVHDQALALLLVKILTGDLVHGHDRLVARVVGVVHRRPVDDPVALTQGEVV